MRERVKLVQGSHDDIDILNQAFAGAGSVSWLALPNPPLVSGFHSVAIICMLAFIAASVSAFFLVTAGMSTK
jgi:hypothetical protein